MDGNGKSGVKGRKRWGRAKEPRRFGAVDVNFVMGLKKIDVHPHTVTCVAVVLH